MRNLFVFVGVVMVLAACSNNGLDGSGMDGKPVSEFEARSILVNTQRWCDTTVQKDGNYSVDIFAVDGSGQHALWNVNTGNYTSTDPMSWDVSDDLLTRILPRKYSPNVLRQRIRFTTAHGRRTLTLLDENGDRQMLTSCSFVSMPPSR